MKKRGNDSGDSNKEVNFQCKNVNANISETLNPSARKCKKKSCLIK